jgi:hypothetical protein
MGQAEIATYGSNQSLTLPDRLADDAQLVCRNSQGGSAWPLSLMGQDLLAPRGLEETNSKVNQKTTLDILLVRAKIKSWLTIIP